MISVVQILPAINMTICFMAGVVYTFDLDWRHALYWYAAAALTFSVTF